MKRLLCLAVVTFFPFHADGQRCVKQTLYWDSVKCEGSSKQVYAPVGTGFHDSCHSMNSPGLGPMVTASYCDLKDRYNTDALVGTEDCSTDEDDDSILFSMKQAYRSNKCIGTVTGHSFTFECMDGPCPTGELEDARTEAQHQKLYEIHNDWMLKHLFDAIGIN